MANSIFKIASFLAVVYLRDYEFAKDFERFLEGHSNTSFECQLSWLCFIFSLFLLYFDFGRTHRSLSHLGMKEILVLQLRKTFGNEPSLILIMCAS